MGINKALEIALLEYGKTEVIGPRHNGDIVNYFASLGHGWVQDDETAWCAAFAGYCLEQAGYGSTKKLNARSYLNYGKPTKTPKIGDIVVFWRGTIDGWQGHVGFYINTVGDDIFVLGGNQSNQVNISPYPKDRLLGYRTAFAAEDYENQSVTTLIKQLKEIISALRVKLSK